MTDEVIRGRLWHHEGREIRISQMEIRRALRAEYWCNGCGAAWVDLVAPDPRGAVKLLTECPACLDAEALTDPHRTIYPEQALARGMHIPLTEEARQGLIADFIRTPEAQEALTGWAMEAGIVYRLDATWPDDQIEASMKIAAAAVARPL